MSEAIFILVVVFVGYVAYTVLNDTNPVVDTAAHADVNAQEAVVQEVSRESGGDEVKNPLTGEVSKIPNNYRFGKRWIKEALVAEGLLDQVYKNNEINEAVNAKVQVAMMSLKNMDKYKV
jgi:hypothetical protein